jgi:hypothetical protein
MACHVKLPQYAPVHHSVDLPRMSGVNAVCFAISRPFPTPEKSHRSTQIIADPSSEVPYPLHHLAAGPARPKTLHPTPCIPTRISSVAGL